MPGINRRWIELAGSSGMVLAAALLLAVPARAQTPDRDFHAVDRIVAVVGARPILLSRIQEEINIRKNVQGIEIPTDSLKLVALLTEILTQLVDEELMVQAAQRDTSIVFSMTDVQAAVDEAVRNVRSQYTSDVDFTRNLRLAGWNSMEDYRQWVYEQKRREVLSRQLVQKLRQKGTIKPLPATEAEAREYYEKNKGLLPKRPETVSFKEIVARPEPDSAALALARSRADSLVDQLRRGADFVTLAKRFTEDEATKEQGGELGWFRRGAGLAREFEAVAFSLRPGQISDPVRTPFGYHIIQVERIDAAEIQARHILIIPQMTDANRELAKFRADSVAVMLKAGAPFDSLVRIYHDPTEDAIADNITREALPEEYKTALAGAKPGDIIGPFAVPSPAGGTKYVVAIFERERAAGEMGYDELRDQIKSNLGDKRAMDKYLDELKKRTYIDIRL